MGVPMFLRTVATTSCVEGVKITLMKMCLRDLTSVWNFSQARFHLRKAMSELWDKGGLSIPVRPSSRIMYSVVYIMVMIMHASSAVVAY